MNEITTTALIVGGLAVAVVLLILGGFARMLRKVGPNQALIRYGLGGTRIVQGGAGLVVPLIHQSQELSLELMSFDVAPEQDLYTNQGVAVNVEAVAQIKIKAEPEFIRTAAEQFLNKSKEEIKNIATQTLEGHLRAILGTMTVEDIYQNRDAFASKVQEVAAGDMANMGLSIVSFTIRDIRDNQGYLEALGKPRIAQVKRDAQIGEAIGGVQQQSTRSPVQRQRHRSSRHAG